MKKILGLVIVLFSLLPVSGEEINDAGEYLKKNVVVRKLSNGITLVMLKRDYSPTLAFEMSFRVGSADESYNTQGAAHLLEHMLFKGTDRVGTTNWNAEKKLLNRIEEVGEALDRLRLTAAYDNHVSDLAKELASLQKEASRYVVNSPYDRIYSENGGVGFNASTSRDKTGYYVQLPSSKMELWAKIESERLRNPVLREYYTERANVLEERLMRTESDGSGLFFERFLAMSFAAHPYRHPTIGWASGIPQLSISDVRNFYRTYYIPSRMTITIVGRQNVEETYRIINRYFASLHAATEPRPVAVREPSPRGETRFDLFFESSPELLIAWHKPAFPSRDDAVCDVMARVLGTGKSSRLYRSLVLEKKVATSIEVWNGAPGERYDNLFLIHAIPAQGVAAENLEKAIYVELEKLKDVKDDELARIRNSIESEMVFGLSSNEGLASLLSYYQTLTGNWASAVSYVEMVRSITAKDISEATKYLSRDNRVVGILRDSRREAVK